MPQLVDEFIETRQLPDAFKQLSNDYYLPLAEWLHDHCNSRQTTVVGVNGAQGTGKSTLSALLKIFLEQKHHWHVAVLSLDDTYLSRAERTTLAQTVHPLLQTRGVPGTHDVQLARDSIRKLKMLDTGQSMALPRFDKALDDRKSPEQWESFQGPTDLVIFEGWCLGSGPMDSKELASPINNLEIEEDNEAVWRNYINLQLQTRYRELFDEIDVLIVLQAPNFTSVRRWRMEQEQKLAAQSVSLKNALGPMNKRALNRFMAHYERLTRHNLVDLPARADVLLVLDDDHQIIEAKYRKPGSK